MSKCSACGSEHFKFVCKAKDLDGYEIEIWLCEDCGLQKVVKAISAKSGYLKE